MPLSLLLSLLLLFFGVAVLCANAQLFNDATLAPSQCVFIDATPNRNPDIAYTGSSNCAYFTGHGIVFNMVIAERPHCYHVVCYPAGDGSECTREDDFGSSPWDSVQPMPSYDVTTSVFGTPLSRMFAADNNVVCLTVEQTDPRTPPLQGQLIASTESSLQRQRFLGGGLFGTNPSACPYPGGGPMACTLLDYCRQHANDYYGTSYDEGTTAAVLCYPYLARLRLLPPQALPPAPSQLVPFMLNWTMPTASPMTLQFARASPLSPPMFKMLHAWDGGFFCPYSDASSTPNPDPSACTALNATWTFLNALTFSSFSDSLTWASDEPGYCGQFQDVHAVLAGAKDVPPGDLAHISQLALLTDPATTTTRMWCKASIFCTEYNGLTRGCSGYGMCPRYNATMCNGHGTCTRESVCICDPGYAGVTCELHVPTILRHGWGETKWAMVVDPNYCTDSTMTSATCGLFTLSKLLLFYQDPPKYQPILGSLPCSVFDPCGPMGYCIDNPVSSSMPTCVCYDGWSTVPATNAVYWTVMHDIVQSWAITEKPNDCIATPSLCQNGATCHFSGVCICPAGFTGEFCEIDYYTSIVAVTHGAIPPGRLFAEGTVAGTDALNRDQVFISGFGLPPVRKRIRVPGCDAQSPICDAQSYVCNSFFRFFTCYSGFLSCAMYNPCGSRGTCIDPYTTTLNHDPRMVEDPFYAWPPGKPIINYPTCSCSIGWFGGDASVPDTDGSAMQAYANMLGTSDSHVAFVYMMTHPCAIRVANLQPTSSAAAQMSSQYASINQCRIWVGSPSQLDRYVHQPRSGDSDTIGAIAQPLWYNNDDELTGLVSSTSSDRLTAMHVTSGYNCVDKRILDVHNGHADELYSGANCEPCPLCNRNNSKCVSDNSTVMSKTRVCACFENWGGATCEVQLCPWNRALAGHGACSRHYTNDSLSQGVCVQQSANVVIHGITYSGSCSCFDGFTGDDCSVQVCPLGPNGKICSGTDSKHARSVDVDINAHGYCNETLGVCVCYAGWTSGLTSAEIGYSACELSACKLSTSTQRECNGLVYTNGNSRVVSVCNRAPPDPSCRCTLNATADPSKNFYGDACDIPYSAACSGDGGLTYCSQTSVTCAVDASVAAKDGTAAPHCSCKSDTDPVFPLCNVSACVPYQNPVNACHIDDGTTTLSTGICVQYCGNTPCPVVTSGSSIYGCECFAMNNATGLQCFPGDVDKSQCVFYDRTNPSTIKSPCSVAKADCTYFNSVSNSFTLCNGVTQYGGASACIRNDSDATGDSWYCSCPPEYSGTHCETRNTSYCGTGCPNLPVAQCKNSQCLCVDNIHTGTNCSTDMCTSTGGTIVSSNNTGLTLSCQCPDGSFYCGVNNRPSNCTQPGCIKLCPLYQFVQCGQERKQDKTYRCTNRTVYANDSSATPTCDCSGLGTPIDSGTGNMLYVNSSNGACEPYCLNGGIYSVQQGKCTCTKHGTLAPRCSNPVCNGRGYMANSTSSQCVCNELLDDPATNCSTTQCVSSYETNVTGATQCQCSAPYVNDPIATNVHCVNPCSAFGSPSLSTGKCVCNASFITGAYCDSTLCVSGTMDYVHQTCQCSTGGQWDNVSLSCVFANCEHGDSDGKGGCVCYGMQWGGIDCDQDLCALNHGTAVGADKSWSCSCDPGWYISDASGTQMCSSTFCSPGLPVNCSDDPSAGLEICVFSSFDYNCDCGLASWFLDGACIGSCIHGTINRRVTPPRDLFCDCDLGWQGVACTDSVCDTSNPRIQYSASTGVCECVAPWQNTSVGCTQNICGIGQTVTDAVIPAVPTGSNGTIQISSKYMCSCRDPMYTLNGTYSMYPCVKNCFLDTNESHVEYALEDECACSAGYFGEFCNITSPVVTTSSSPVLESWAVALIATVASVVGVTLIVVGLVWFGVVTPPTWASISSYSRIGHESPPIGQTTNPQSNTGNRRIQRIGHGNA